MTETLFTQWRDIRERLGLCTCSACWSRYLRVLLDELDPVQDCPRCGARVKVVA